MQAITAAIVMIFCCRWPQKTLAKQHLVGGSEGWDVSTDLSSWASSQSFKVGDHLVFNYAGGLHSVVELGGQSSYDQCDINNALDSKNDGKSVIKLEQPGYRYFACGTPGHCNEGMKMKIKISTSSSSHESSITDSHPVPNNNTSSGTVSTTCVSFTHIIILTLLLVAALRNA